MILYLWGLIFLLRNDKCSCENAYIVSVLLENLSSSYLFIETRVLTHFYLQEEGQKVEVDMAIDLICLAQITLQLQGPIIDLTDIAPPLVMFFYTSCFW